MTSRYDTIGLNYANLRKPDARIAAAIRAALGPVETVVNVGAGAGNYEPADCHVTAVEPSAEMIAQRGDGPTQVIQGRAEHLPFDDNSFDAAMASLTVHHWEDKPKGLREMRRVSRGKVVILTYDPAFRAFWLTDYFPQLITLDEGQMPNLNAYAPALGPVDIHPVDIPHDCSDGFLAGYWRRPAAYLDPKARAAMSSFWAIDGADAGLKALEADLKSGAWHARYGSLMTKEALDCGYRLVVTR